MQTSHSMLQLLIFIAYPVPQTLLHTMFSVEGHKNCSVCALAYHNT